MRTDLGYWYRLPNCPRLYFFLNAHHIVISGYVVLPRQWDPPF
jgi:hypothetical protein